MKAFDNLVKRAQLNPKHIVLAEGEDERIIEAAIQAHREGIAKMTLLGEQNRVRQRLQELDVDDDAFIVIDPSTSEHLENYAQAFYELRRHKGIDEQQALETIKHPLYFAAMMVHLGQADGSVAGALYTTADTVRAAIQVIGLQSGYSLVSSFFIMMLCAPHHYHHRGALIFADCGLVVNPDTSELAQIAMVSAESARNLIRVEPHVAMLSFSTSHSAKHPLVDKVVAATKIVKEKMPDLKIDGDVQLDAAIVPEVSSRKVPGSAIQGKANVLIFPNLEAGNIGYKLAERIGEAKAIGPLLQGLKKPANDLSRGCSPDDVFRVIAVTVAQAQAVSD